jgi:hypothetical protein
MNSLYVPIFKYTLGPLETYQMGRRIYARNFQEAFKISQNRLSNRAKKTYWKVSLEMVKGV